MYILLAIAIAIAVLVFIIRSFVLIIKFFNWLYPIILISLLAIGCYLYLGSLKPGDVTNLINSIGDFIKS